MLNFTHSKRNANSNYPEIPYLLIRLTKQVEQTLNNSIGNDTFLYTGYMMHRGNLTTFFKIIHAHCPLIQQLHFQELIHKYIHTCIHTHMIHNNLDRSQIHYAKQRKLGTKSCMHSEGFHFMTFWKRQKFRSGEQISDFPGIMWKAARGSLG